MKHIEILNFYKNYIQGKALINAKTIDDQIKEAMGCAYSTAQRTFKGISAYVAEKNIAFDNLAKNIKNYLGGNPAADRGDYTRIHEKWCIKFRNDMPTYKPTDGHAQKIINMTMKYLYCLFYDQTTKSLKIYPKHFDYCHMTLDKYTFNWFKEGPFDKTIKKDLSKIKYEWSKLDYSLYNRVQGEINVILQKNQNYAVSCATDNTPAQYYILPQKSIEAEFVIWHQEQINELRKEIDKAKLDFNRLGIQYI